MLLNSLKLLLLSNAITSRRDKSILYSIATITILVISAFIAYNNLFLLFLDKGIVGFVDLLQTTATILFIPNFISSYNSLVLFLSKEIGTLIGLVHTTATILVIPTFISSYNSLVLFLDKGIVGFVGLLQITATTNNFHIFIWFILLFLYSQKHIITLKKLTGLIIIVFITPLILHFINFSLPYLLDNLPFILFEFNQLISRILVFFVSRVHQVLLKIFSKKGFIDILTSICIIYVIKVVLLGSLSILSIVSNLFITNCFFSLTIDFYSITLIKVVTPYMEKIFTSIIKPFFNSNLSPIHCDSPEVVAKLFSELPFSNVDSNVMIKECRTSTNYKSRQDLLAEFKAFRLKISSYTPSLIVSMQSGHESNIEQGEHSRGQLFKGKKRALYNTQEEGYNKRAKTDLCDIESTTVTREDFDGEDWNLHSIYEKINILMEDPYYNRKWEINMLFEDKKLQSHFYNYIKVFELTSCKHVRHTPLAHLKKNIEEHIKTDVDFYSIKKQDFTKNSLNLLSVYIKLSNVVEKEDFNINWKLNKLKFEPRSLRLPFYATIEALHLNICKNANDMTISGLKNRIWEEYSLKNHKPNSITRDDFTEDGLNLESIYNKIKQSIEDGELTKTDSINKLFTPGSKIRLDFYTKLKTLNLIDPNKKINTYSLKIRTLMNLLEKVVDVPSTKNNSITREDLRDEDWDLYSIHEKITDIMDDPNFNRKSKIAKLEFEPSILRKEFYAYIKNFNLAKANPISQTTILNLKNNLEKHFKDNES